MTRRGVGLVVAAVMLWVLGRGFGVDELHTAATATILLVVAGVLWVAVPQRLTASLHVEPGLVTVDEDAVAHVGLRNDSFLPTGTFTLLVGYSAGVTLHAAERLRSMSPRSRRSIELHLSATSRGFHHLGPLEAVRQDPFGIAVRRTLVHASAQVAVVPRITPLAPSLVLAGQQAGAAPVARRAAGMGSDLVEIRPYLPGDDLRSVHWPSTAHRGELMIRRVEEPRSTRVAIFVDTRSGGYSVARRTASFEGAVAAAASIAVHFLDRGVDVTVVGHHPVSATDGGGRGRLLEDFAGLDLGGTPLERLAADVEAEARGAATFVAVLPAPLPTELVVLQRATRNAPQRLAIVLGETHLGGSGDSGSKARTVSDTALSRRQHEGVASLRRAGWLSAAMDADDTVETAWHELLTTTPRSAP